MSAYTIVKFFHVLLAIIAVGFNASYGIWLARAAREPEHELHVLRGIKVLDDRFANPAYALLLVTGLLMIALGDLSVTTFWLAGGLVLYAIVVVVGIVVYSPALRRQIELLETGGPGTPDYAQTSARARNSGILLAVLVVSIVFLMVTKPTL